MSKCLQRKSRRSAFPVSEKPFSASAMRRLVISDTSRSGGLIGLESLGGILGTCGLDFQGDVCPLSNRFKIEVRDSTKGIGPRFPRGGAGAGANPAGASAYNGTDGAIYYRIY
jgi:hypothetical protein